MKKTAFLPHRTLKTQKNNVKTPETKEIKRKNQLKHVKKQGKNNVLPLKSSLAFVYCKVSMAYVNNLYCISENENNKQ